MFTSKLCKLKAISATMYWAMMCWRFMFTQVGSCSLVWLLSFFFPLVCFLFAYLFMHSITILIHNNAKVQIK